MDIIRNNHIVKAISDDKSIRECCTGAMGILTAWQLDKLHDLGRQQPKQSCLYIVGRELA